jgi:Tfp pilus assembly protein PilF/CRP-like cAMP-binding protein
MPVTRNEIRVAQEEVDTVHALSKLGFTGGTKAASEGFKPPGKVPRKNSIVDVLSFKKKTDSALSAAHSWQFRASMQSKDGWLSHLHRNLNNSHIKTLEGDSLTEKQKEKRDSIKQAVLDEVDKIDRSISYTKAFSKEVVPDNAKRYDPLKVVADYDVLETQVVLGKEAGLTRQKLIENELAKSFKRNKTHPASLKVSMSKVAIADQAFPFRTKDTLLHKFMDVGQLDSRHVTYSDLLHNAALVDMQAKEYRSALKKLDGALMANRKHYPSFFNRAKLYVVLGQKGKAVKDFLVCSKLKPKSPAAFYNIGIVYSMGNKQELASKYFKLAHDVDSDNFQVLSNFALCLRRDGMYGKARHEYVLLKEHYRLENAKLLRKCVLEKILNDRDAKTKFFPGSKTKTLPKHFEFGTRKSRTYIRECYDENIKMDKKTKDDMKAEAIHTLLHNPHSKFPMSDYKLEDMPIYLNPYLTGGFLSSKDEEDEEAGAHEILTTVPPHERTPEDIDVIMKELGALQFMERFPHTLRRKLWELFTYRHVRGGTVISTEGDTPKCLNIVWEGKVMLQREVYHKFSSRTMTVGTVTNGGTICEMELIRKIPLRHSCVAATDVNLLSLSIPEYNKTIKMHDEGDAVYKLELINGARIFRSWSDHDLNRISKLARSRFYETGQLIIEQGAVADELFFMRRGLAKAIHKESLDGVDYDLEVAKLVPGDIFGERSIVDPINGKYRFSIKCDTRVEVLVLGKEMIPVAKVTHAVRDAIDEMALRKFGRQSAIQAITDMKANEINRKKVLHKLSYINHEQFRNSKMKMPPWQKKKQWLNPGVYKDSR